MDNRFFQGPTGRKCAFLLRIVRSKYYLAAVHLLVISTIVFSLMTGIASETPTGRAATPAPVTTPTANTPLPPGPGIAATPKPPPAPTPTPTPAVKAAQPSPVPTIKPNPVSTPVGAAFPAAGASPMDWSSPPVNISSSAGSVSGSRQWFEDSASNLHIVYVDNSTANTNNNVFYAYKPSSGSWTAPVNLSNNATGSAEYPRIRVDSVSNVYVAWDDNSSVSTSNQVYFRSKPSGGAWSVAVNLTSGIPGSHTAPSLSSLEPTAGAIQLYLTWLDANGSTTDVFNRKWDAAAGWSSPTNVSSQSSAHLATQAALSFDSTNTAHLSWSDNFPGNYDIFYATLAYGSSVWSAPLDISTTSGTASPGTSRKPTLKTDKSNNLYAMWEEQLSTSPSNYEVFYSDKLSGGAWSAPINVSNYAGGDDVNLDFRVARNGKIVAAWQEWVTSTNAEIFSSVKPFGLAWSTPVNVSNTPSTNSQNLSMQMDSAIIRVHVVYWESATGVNGDIFYANLPNNGAWTAPVNISNNASNSQGPAITVDSTRTYVNWLDGPASNRQLYYASQPAPLGAGFGATPTSGAAPLVVAFTDQSAGGPTGWSWNFGDGAGSSVHNPSHTYLSSGNYSVTLTVTASTANSTTTKSNYIQVTGWALMADFTASPMSGSAPLAVHFADATAGGPTSWSWNFGDGAGSSSQNPDHTYASTGNYTVILTASAPGASATVTKPGLIQAGGSGLKPFLPPVNISSSSGTSNFDSSGSNKDANDNIHVVVSDNTGGNYDIWYSVLPSATGVWTAGVNNSTATGVNISNTPGSSTSPGVRSDGAGNVWASWLETPSGGVGAVYFASKPSGGVWSAPVNVSGAAGLTGACTTPSLEFYTDATGNFVFVVFSHTPSGGGITDVYAMRLTPGGAWEPPVNISHGTGNSSNIGRYRGASNNLFVSWQQANPVNTDIFLSTLAPGGSWDAPINISNTANNSVSGRPRPDNLGNIYVSWQEDTGGGIYDIFLATKPAGGAWGAGVNVSNSASNSNSQQVSVNGAGLVQVLWLEQVSGKYDVFYSSRPLGGVFSAPVNVSNLPGDSLNPRFALDGSNGLHLAYNDDTPGNQDVYYQYLPEGGSWTSPMDVSKNSGASRNPNVIVDDGWVHVLWRDNTTGNDEVFYVNKPLPTVPLPGTPAPPASGPPIPPEPWSTPANLSNSAGVSTFSAPQSSKDSNNNIHVVYYDNTTGNNDIYYTAMVTATGLWTPPVNVSNTSGSSTDPRVQADTAGNVFAVWSDDTGTPGTNASYFATKPWGGTWETAVRFGPTGLTGASSSPAVAAYRDPSGGSHVYVVLATGGLVGNSDIYAMHRTPGGVWEAPVNLSNNNGASTNPTMNRDSSNNLHLAWTDSTPGNGDIFYAFLPQGGSWTSSFNVSNTVAASQNQRLHVDASGNVYVVWEENTGLANDIFFRGKTVASGWGSAVNVSNSSADSTSARMSKTGTGPLHIIWQEVIGPYVYIYYSKQLSGDSFSPPFNVYTGKAANPRITTDGFGGVHLTYDDATVNQEVYYQYLPPGGAWSAPLNISNNSGLSRNPQIFTDKYNARIVWQDNTSGPGNEEVFSSTRSLLGVTPVTVQAGTAVVGSGGSVNVPITVKNFNAVKGLGAYDITVTYNASVINITNVTGGAAPFDGSPTKSLTTGQAVFNAFQGGSIPGPTGDIVVANLVVNGIGPPGQTSALTVVLKASSVVDTDGASVPSAPVNGQVTIFGANFTASPLSGAAPLLVQFTDLSPGATSWSWNFGDGSGSSSQNPSHTYQGGNYTVSLTATRGTDSRTFVAYIQVIQANFTGTPTSGSTPLSVAFTDQSTGTVNTWYWSFGDGAGSSSQNPSHTYGSTGSYTVTLTVSGPAGASFLTRPNYVTVTNILHTPGFSQEIGADNIVYLNINVNRIFNPSTQVDQQAAGGIGAYDIRLTYPGGTAGNAINIMAVKGVAPFSSVTAGTIPSTSGALNVNSFQTGSDPQPPLTLGQVAPRIIGSSTVSQNIVLTFNTLADVTAGANIPADGAKTYTVKRGDARQDNAITISDALFIAQSLAGLRGIGEGTTLTHGVNGASVKLETTTTGEKLTIADALLIAQFLAGLRDASFN